ncbi:adenosylcobinamide-phosphate synthase CbiB [Ilumatobacter nonamiensis]|uniref:adenosylcobinamide-phosphate synthase CbiB n=1 Tax=Ilumatobacter nonamiensis TaxID=467093 RepID=UPI00034C7218|nr:adenosylcobinamide-phosphate synthase CbiB [Ilumatobacter nonamiensis]
MIRVAAPAPGLPTAMVGAFAVDRVLGEPPASLHPVAAFGSLMNALEARVHADSRRAGMAYTAVGIATGLTAAAVLRRMLGRTGSTVVAGSIAIAGCMLEREGVQIAERLRAGDIIGARNRLGTLVGRTTDDLTEHEIARAVVESLAENTVDAVTATLFWGSVGGAAGALVHRAVNTMDAMVGHRSDRYRRFGWASARLDDVLNWVPARLTALATMVAVPSRAGTIWRIVRRDARRHPSPNGGVVEAAFAAALDVRIGGRNRYAGTVEDRGVLGDGPAPVADDIERAARLARRVGAITAIGCVVVACAGSTVARRRAGWSR